VGVVVGVLVLIGRSGGVNDAVRVGVNVSVKVPVGNSVAVWVSVGGRVMFCKGIMVTGPMVLAPPAFGSAI
jgi:hypothetical protein